MKQHRILRSFIIRAELKGTKLKLKLQHIQTGELHEFKNWADLVNYANGDLNNSIKKKQNCQEL